MTRTHLFFLFLLLNCFLLTTYNATAQETDRSLPPSHYIAVDSNSNNAQVVEFPVTLPALDNDSLRTYALSTADSNYRNMIVGIVLTQNIDFFQNATPIDLSNGQRIWRLNIVSPTAEALQLVFSKFQLPANGKLYIYNEDRTMTLGAFTAASASTALSDTFAIQSIHGGNIYVEYTEGPGVTSPTADIKICKIAHFFESIFRSEAEVSLPLQALCNVDVACPLGDGWGPEIKAVVLFHIFKIDKNNNEVVVTGSGTLLNSKTVPFKPYLITAYHVVKGIRVFRNEILGDDGSNIPYHPIPINSLTMYFNYQSKSCGGTQGFPDLSDIYTLTGGTLVSYEHNQSWKDYALLELSQAPSLALRPCYAGWDRTLHDPEMPTTSFGSQFTGIHHPQLQQKKISRSITNLQYVGYRGINQPNWYGVVWDQGITEGGSSGSALFNQAHRVIGGLTAGTSSCTDQSGIDTYYSLAVAWKDDDWSRYLAPGDTSLKMMDTYCPVNYCANGIQDPGETGVDCGGSCPNRCGITLPSIQQIHLTNNNLVNNFCITTGAWVTVTADIPYQGMTGSSIDPTITVKKPVIEWTILSGNVSIIGGLNSKFIRYQYSEGQALSMNLNCNALFPNGLMEEEVTIVATLYDDQGINRGSYTRIFTLKKGINNFPGNGTLVNYNVCLNTPVTLGFTSDPSYTYLWTCPSNDNAMEALQGGATIGQPVFNASQLYQFPSDETMLRFNLLIDASNGCSAELTHYIKQNAFTATAPSELKVCKQDSITIAAKNGITPYTYTWANTTGIATPEITNATSSTPVFTSIPAKEVRTYTVEVKDASGCKVVLPLQVDYKNSDLQAVSGMSYNICDVVSLNGTQLFSGGVAPYTFTTSSTSTPAATLADYNYTVGASVSTRSITVTDVEGCNATSTFTTTTPSQGPLKITTISSLTHSQYLIGSNSIVSYEPNGVGYFVINACTTDSTEFEADFTIEGGCAPYSFYWSYCLVNDNPRNHDHGPLFMSKNPYVKKLKFKVPEQYATEDIRFPVITLVVTDSKGSKTSIKVLMVYAAKPVQPVLSLSCPSGNIQVNASNYFTNVMQYEWQGTPLYTNTWIYGSGMNILSKDESKILLQYNDFTERSLTFNTQNVCNTVNTSITLGKVAFKLNGTLNSGATIPVRYNYGQSRVRLDATPTTLCFSNYFISVQECNPNGSVVAGSTELTQWFENGNYVKPDNFDIDNFCTQKGIPLQEGKYYRVKFALATYGWSEKVQLIYMVPCNTVLANYTINNKAINISGPIKISKGESIIMNASNTKICISDYFFGIQECDQYGNVPQNAPVYADWINYYDSRYSLNAFDIRSYCANKGMTLECQKFYKVKLATGGGTGWQELNTIIYLENCIEAGNNVSVCQGSSVQLSASMGTNYLWTTSHTLSAYDIPNPYATPYVTTTYELTATDSYTGTVVKDYVTVTVNPLPDITVPPQINMCSESIGGLVLKSNTTSLNSYSWSPAAGLSSTTIAQPKITPSASQLYTVTVKNGYNCVTTASTQVNVQSKCSSPYFDGTNKVIKILATPAYATSNFVMEAWVMLPAQTTGVATILSSRSTSNNTGFLWSIVENGTKMKFYSGTSTITSAAFPTLYDGQCHHIAIRRADDYANFLVDGVVINGGSHSLFNPIRVPSYIQVGYDAIDGLPLTGAVSEIRFWNKNLGNSAIADNRYKIYNTTTANLVAYFRFQQDNTQIVWDESATANNGFYGTSQDDLNADPIFNTADCGGKSAILWVTPPSLVFNNTTMTVTYGLTGFPNGSTLKVYLSDAFGEFSGIPTKTIVNSSNSGSFTLSNLNVLPNGSLYKIKMTNATGNVVQYSNSFTILRPNTGIDFNTTTQVTTIPHHNSYNVGTGDFTLEAWVVLKPLRQAEPSWRVFMSKANNTNMQGFIWGIGSDRKMLIRINGVYSKSNALPEFFDNQCHHVAVSRQSGTIVFYVDGVMKGVDNMPSRDMNSTSNLLIGNYQGIYAMYGSIQEIRFWNVARTNDQILSGMNTQYNQYSAGLKGYWRFREYNTQQITDGSSLLNHGYLGTSSGTDSEDPIRTDITCNIFNYDRTEVIENNPDRFKEAEVVYYPNPFDNTLTVIFRDFSTQETTAVLSIINANGIEVYRNEIGLNVPNELHLDLVAGMYMAIIQHGDQVYQHKIIKTR